MVNRSSETVGAVTEGVWAGILEDSAATKSVTTDNEKGRGDHRKNRGISSF